MSSPLHSSDTLMARFVGLHPKLIDLSLDRILRLLAALGSPQKRLPPVIHVAGTNGKGSTIAFMRAMLEAGGKTVHVYTSPHLVRFHERIRLAGRLVEEAHLADALFRCETANDGGPITVFEMTTAAAFLLFSERPADALLLEVGLGGRFDATNVVPHPAACVITPVSLDHMEYLGNTVAEIAREKAGVLKSGVPAVFAAQDEEALTILETVAARVGAPCVIGGQDFRAHEERGRLIFEDEHRLLDLPLPRLAGRHHFTNAATAIATLHAAGMGVPTSAIDRGLNTVQWPARLQRLTSGKLIERVPAGTELWLDGAHNPDGARAIAAAMAERGEASSASLVLIMAVLETKDVEGILKPFLGLAQDVLAVPISDQTAAYSPEHVAAIGSRMGLRAQACESISAAFDSLMARDWKTPPRILICGSLYLAGEVLKADETVLE